ncbi:MAG: MFS transporter [Chloroflexota bacterium]
MDFSNPEQRRKMLLLGGLYTSQFLGLGFILTAIPAIMRENGAGLDQIGWIYALGIAWMIRFLWAPFVDRYGSKRFGHYRIWLLVFQTLMVVMLVGASLFSVETQLPQLAIFFSLLAISSATQGIAADALAVTILSAEERGMGNGIRGAGGIVGNLIGGGIVLIAYTWIGWSTSLLILAALTSLPLISIWRHKEQPAPADARTEEVGYKDLARFFKRPRVGRWVLILITYALGISMVYALINPMLVDLGWSLDRIGIATNIVGSVVSIAGAGLAGWVVQKIGRKTTILVTNIVVAGSVFALFPAARGVDNAVAIYASLCILLFAYGGNSTVLSTMIMDKSNPETAGTDYSLQYSIASMVSLIFASIALVIAESIGYVGVLWIGISLTILALGLVWAYNEFEPENVAILSVK